MKDFCEDYLIKQKGVMRLENKDELSMTQQVLTVILFMLKHGFYNHENELNKISRPIVSIMDGSNDSYHVNGKDM